MQANLVIIENANQQHRLTITSDEVRLKIKKNTTHEEKQDLIHNTLQLLNCIDKPVLTLRGNPSFKNNTFYVLLHTGSNYSKKSIYSYSSVYGLKIINKEEN